MSFQNSSLLTLLNSKVVIDKSYINISVKDWLIDMPDLNNYDQIYIGIGAKYYKKNYPLNINTGINQIIPSFLNSENILIIIIDKFNIYELNDNIEYILYYTENNYEILPLKYNIIIINNYITQLLANNLLNYLNNLNSINNLIICNYVYYFNENINKYEKNNINIIDNVIKYIVNYNNKQYKDNIYNWLGVYKPKYICNYYFTLQVKLFLNIPKNLLNSQQKKFINSNIINFVDNY